MPIAPAVIDVSIHPAKLRRPRFGDGLVSRPRLTASLDRCLDVPLTLVAAPAGFGKTTLLAEWAAQQTIPVAWLSVDADDDDLTQFVAHLVAGIETAVSALGGDLRPLVRDARAASATAIGVALADRLFARADDLVLIFDDVHLAASPAVEQLVRGWLERPPPRVHLILATRHDPALPLTRLRLHGHLHELRAGDLRFSDTEAQMLFGSTHPAGVDPALLAALQRQTEGWIAALRLATLVPPTAQDPEQAADAVATNAYLMDVLIDEVLDKQPVATQEFLLRTGIVDRLSLPLAMALLDEDTPDRSRTTLNELLREHLFIDVDTDDGAWVRYHPIFHRLLRHQVESRYTPAERAALHTRASDWFADNGQLGEAVRHRLLAGGALGAAHLIERHVHTLLDREDWRSLEDWLRLLPDALIATRPALLLATAWISHLSGHLVPVQATVSAVETLLAAPDIDDATRQELAAEGEALVLTSLLPIEQDPPAALARARAIMARVSPDHRFPFGLAMVSLGCALQTCGQTEEAVRWLTAAAARDEERIDAGSIRAQQGLIFVHRQAGNLHACASVARHMLTLAEREGLFVAQGWAHWALGWVAYQHDALDDATAHFAAIVADHRRVHLTCVEEASFGLALIAQARGDPGAADAALRRMRDMALEVNALEYFPWLLSCEASLALRRGQTEVASRWLSAAGPVAIADAPLLRAAHPFLIAIKTRLAEGTAASLVQARRDVAQLRAFAETRHHTTRLVEILALEALVLEALGQRAEALASLARSLELGKPGGFCRTYRDLGLRLTALITLLTGEDAIRTETRAPAGFRAAPSGIAMLDVLTVREADVIAALARHLSYREVGKTLFISPETVKKHSSHIYRKLGVSGRHEAIAMAASLGWVPQN